MAVEQNSNELIQVVTLLGAAVVAVPLFRKLGLGSVLGYLFAGLVIGPFGFGLFTDPNSILHVAELGVVMFLFVIGLEMRPSHLWDLRGQIFGLGSMQIAVCSAALTAIGIAFGYSPAISFISATGFVLTSTAIVMQILGERGDVGLPHGQKTVSILLFEDLLIVPLLALVALLSPLGHSNGIDWSSIAIALGSLLAVIAAGRWLLNPFFHILANSRAREVLTAAALLVVLGTALLMQVSGLSMALGAFLAGVLLAESTFRHQIEADIEPFRGILLGLFFIGVGMSLDLKLVLDNAPLVIAGVVILMAGKGLCIYLVARFMGSTHHEALDRAAIMAQGGEFAVVLYAAATQAKVIPAEVNANMTAIVVLSMALTPLVVMVVKKILSLEKPSLEGVEEVRDLSSCGLVIGFGRFGQVVSQLLLARDMDITIIDSNPERIRNAGKFGFKIYFGDGSRLDVLRASGAEKVCFIAVCIDDKKLANKIALLVKTEFPQAKVLVRSYDRVHARELVLAGVDYQLRETFESAIIFGQEALRAAEVPEDDIISITEDIRRRDSERFAIETDTNSSTTQSAKDLIHFNIPKPTPLVEPKRQTRILNTEGQNLNSN
ncbi:MAG: monovalent cation:proton antiporter-2 (CPA2) family protein [Bdellovibrionota bacterium]